MVLCRKRNHVHQIRLARPAAPQDLVDRLHQWVRSHPLGLRVQSHRCHPSARRHPIRPVDPAIRLHQQVRSHPLGLQDPSHLADLSAHSCLRDPAHLGGPACLVHLLAQEARSGRVRLRDRQLPRDLAHLEARQCRHHRSHPEAPVDPRLPQSRRRCLRSTPQPSRATRTSVQRQSTTRQLQAARSRARGAQKPREKTPSDSRHKCRSTTSGIAIRSSLPVAD